MTGGTGFLGRSVLQALGGHATLTVLSRDPDTFLHKHPRFRALRGLSFVQGDVRSFDFPAGHYSHVLHAATDTQAGPTDAVRLHDEIVQGTRRVLDFARVCGAQRFLLTSSGAVYGPQSANVDRITESDLHAPSPLDAGSVYGQGKRVAEHLCSLYHAQYGLHCTVARCFAFVGTHLPLDGRYALGNFIRDALAPDCAEILVQGDGTPVRSYLHADDLVHWLLAILARGASCRAYNVGSDQAISIADLACLVRDLLAPGKPVRVSRQAADNVDRSRYVPSISRARNELGLDVRIPLADAIRLTAAALRGGC